MATDLHRFFSYANGIGLVNMTGSMTQYTYFQVL